MLDRAATCEAVATVHAPAADARARLANAAAEVEEIDARTCRARLRPDTAEWLTARLLALDCDVEVDEPPELAERLRTFARRLGRATDPDAGGAPVAAKRLLG
jgi:predicted DNA-binding transcriptional regulator YafY